ncbi:family 20 glycosylhydrolase [Maribacter sp.]|uniref:glycoside hydrolase family 20 protein n=1 Tax=Maribacter sp. TaxID=1897614 RepID=UPI0025C2546B|nr:family 20 glycosylhydrolase [Maribacter sp.]
MRFFYKSIVLVLVVVLASCSKSKVFTENDIQIIPKPASLKLETGTFLFNENTQFLAANTTQKEIAMALVNKFKKATGWSLEIVDTEPRGNFIEFVLDKNLENEVYELMVTSSKITIKSNGNAGFIYGLESVRQLLPVAIESKESVANIEWVIPNLTIKDQPRFQWRGLMLDLSRHYFNKEYIKKIIDGLAMHKMNVLHLHLVDDQGWRIEIKKYPKLTEVGAYRVDQEDLAWNARVTVDPNEKGTYGGFLSQKELKELVKYAQSKNIEIVPEIEMPAHVTSAIASYPHLSCLDKPVGVPSGGLWPITDIYCAGKDSTFEFLEDVLTEVMEIFPSKYIHIGGDEATKTNWKVCSHCQKRMRNEGLDNVEELQSYFVKRIEKFINANGKKLVGWDEILEGGLAPDATVMSWRGVKGGVQAAKEGHDVVMTPGTHCYFDHYQGPQNDEPLAWGGFTPLSKVYTFDPIVDSMTPEQAKHVLGGQANLWSEFVPTEAQSEYMIFPRIAALAEAVWSPKEWRDWTDFSGRITTMFKRYQYLGINYAKSAYLVTSDTQINMKEKTVEVLLKNEFPFGDIRYTLDGSALSATSKKYEGALKMSKTTRIRAGLFKNGKPEGKEFDETVKFHKAIGKKVTYKEIYHESYKGAEEFGMVNALRGTKNFHDGQWQGWLDTDMEISIDLEREETIHEVVVGSLENQGSGIYFPIAVEVFISKDGVSYESVGEIKRSFIQNFSSELKDFTLSFKESKARFVKVVATSLKEVPENGGAWLFIDEILVE